MSPLELVPVGADGAVLPPLSSLGAGEVGDIADTARPPAARTNSIAAKRGGGKITRESRPPRARGRVRRPLGAWPPPPFLSEVGSSGAVPLSQMATEEEEEEEVHGTKR